MNERLLMAGPASLAILIAAAAIGRPFGNLPAPDQVVQRLERDRMRVLVGAWLESIGAGLLTLFSIGLAARIRERDGGRTPLGPIAVAGGVGTGTLLLVRAAAVAAAAERGPAEGDTAQTATLAIDIGNLLVGKMAPVSLALVTGAATIAGRRYALMPPWLARVTVALTAGLLSPINFVFIAPGLVWVATIGWLLGRDHE